MTIIKSCSSSFLYSSMKKKFRRIQLIFDTEKWLWKSEFCCFWPLNSTERPKIFLWPFLQFFSLTYEPPNSAACRKITLGTLIIGLQGYLSLWTLTTLLDTQKTLEHLAYMGYTFHAGEENQINALTIANERKIDLGTIHLLRKQVLGLFLILTFPQCLCQPDLWIY